jgi:hypothetical protein
MTENGESERELRPIQYWFIINSVATEFAPDEIREQLLGIPFPTRRPYSDGSDSFLRLDINTGLETYQVIENGVAIETDDAIDVLNKFERQDAARWLMGHCGKLGSEFVVTADQGKPILNPHIGELYPRLQDYRRQ